MSSDQKLVSEQLFVENRKRRPSVDREERRIKSKREYEIEAYGYECKIYKDNLTAIKVDKGQYLVPWTNTQNSLLIDRFDVRHYLEDLNESRTKVKPQLDKSLDFERYRDIESSEEDTDSKNTVGIPYGYGDEKVKSKNTAAIPYNYHDDDNKSKNKTSEITPDSKEQALIIENTAKEICLAKNSNLLEIKIQVKNASNKLYSFLNKQDPLHPYYKRMLWMNQSGLANYDSSSSSEEEEEEIPLQVKAVIEKTAKCVAASNQGHELEQHIKRKNDPKFNFLNENDKYYNYYRSEIDRLSNKKVM